MSEDDEKAAHDLAMYESFKRVLDKINLFEKIKGIHPRCPICATNTWVLMGNDLAEPTITAGVYLWKTYALNCHNCGFIRLHLKQVVDAAVEGLEA